LGMIYHFRNRCQS